MESVNRETNSITYNAEKGELKIVTHYTEEQYTDLYLRDMFAQYYRYCLKSHDPYVRKTTPYLLKITGRGLLLFGLCIHLYYTISGLLQQGLSAGYLLYAAVILCELFLLLAFPALLTAAARRKAGGNRFSRRREIQPAWLAVARGFVLRRTFRQEVTITADGHTTNVPYPGDPVIRCIRWQRHIPVLLSENALYFLPLESGSPSVPYLFAEGLHFARRFYTPAEWALLLEKLKEMKYLPQ